VDQPAAKKSKEYIRPMPRNWWMKKKSYSLFMLRELTCVFVGGYALFLLILVACAANGEAAFIAMLNSPVSIVLHVIALPMVIYHSITWINLTPKVLIIWRGEERVSSTLIAAVHHAGWIVLSIAIFVIVRAIAGT
jgi:fumarate reductase subunit C